MLALITIFCALLAAVAAVPAGVTSIEKRSVIADGNSVHEGTLPDWNFKYHASGRVEKDCPAGTGISKCYIYSFSNNPTANTETISGQKYQNTLFFGPSHPANGQIRQYTFRMKIDPSLTFTSPSGSTTVVGLETPYGGGANPPALSVYLDLRDNKAGIYLRSNPAVPASSLVPLSGIVGKRLLHIWTLKSGPGGWINIDIIDEATGNRILTYNGIGQNSWSNYRMRVGTTRPAVASLSPLKVYWGDWVGTFL